MNGGSSMADGQSTAPISSVGTPLASQSTTPAVSTMGKKLKLTFNNANGGPKGGDRAKEQGLVNGNGGRSDDDDDDED